MKLMTRQFTAKEKILLVVLILIILALCYYKFVYIPVQDQIAEANDQADTLKMELTIADAKLTELRNMKEELDALEAEGSISVMPSYNNVKAELSFLNDVLSEAATYSISIAGVTRDGDQIRRSISMNFTVYDYTLAEQIITALEASSDRCLLSDVSVSCRSNDLTTGDDLVSVSATATFYETVVGGTSDAGLPANTSSTTAQTDSES